VNAVLARYEGTHSFHNFTVRMAAGDAAAKRFILSFRVAGALSLQAAPPPPPPRRRRVGALGGATWGSAGRCTACWSGAGPCRVRVSTGTMHAIQP